VSQNEINRLERERNPRGLCRVLEDEQDARLRENAIWALKRLGEDNAVPALVAAGLREEDSSVRLALVEALRSFHDRRAAPVFLRLLNDDKQNTRLRAIRGLAETRPSEAVRPLIGLLEDSAAAVRIEAARALAAIGDAAALGPISAAIDSTRRPILRARLKLARSGLSARTSRSMLRPGA
jgi:HEAT repeat protein